jgi:hypothetical protein
MGGTAALQLVREAGLGHLVRPGSEHAFTELGSQRVLPVRPELQPLLPGGGLRRGSTIGITTSGASAGARIGGTVGGVRGVDGRRPPTPAQVEPYPSAGTTPVAEHPAATSLLLALLAEASRSGSWCAVVGLSTLGVAAAAEVGIALDRLALVPTPGPDWPTVVAALLDGFDIVVVRGPAREGGASADSSVAPAIASRLAARARQRGGVLVPYGSWPAVDLRLDAVDPVWHGIEAGRGRLRGRQLTVTARGRGAASAPRVTHLWLPLPTGALSVVEPLAPPAEELATIHPLRRRESA